MQKSSEIINNIFYYNKYNGDNPSVYLGSRDRGGWFQDTFGFCEDDAGYPFGSSVSDKDYARYNVVMQNQIYKNSSTLPHYSKPNQMKPHNIILLLLQLHQPFPHPESRFHHLLHQTQ